MLLTITAEVNENFNKWFQSRMKETKKQWTIQTFGTTVLQNQPHGNTNGQDLVAAHPEGRSSNYADLEHDNTQFDVGQRYEADIVPDHGCEVVPN
jgi:hypothetical protein